MYPLINATGHPRTQPLIQNSLRFLLSTGDVLQHHRLLKGLAPHFQAVRTILRNIIRVIFNQFFCSCKTVHFQYPQAAGIGASLLVAEATGEDDLGPVLCQVIEMILTMYLSVVQHFFTISEYTHQPHILTQTIINNAPAQSSGASNSSRRNMVITRSSTAYLNSNWPHILRGNPGLTPRSLIRIPLSTALDAPRILSE